jgi:RNA polymerase sigma-70 factor (ECF subfamily)
MARTRIADGLIAAAVSGDRAALNELLLLHFDRLHLYIARRLPARLDGVLGADDVLQETLVRVIRGIASFEPQDDSSFDRWLETIARHTIESLEVAATAQKRGGKHHRRVHRAAAPASSIADLVDLLSDKSSTVSDRTAKKEAIQAVQVGIACLPDEQQQAVRLRYLRGQSVGETADALGRSPAAVRGLLYRAKVQLREALGRSSRWFSRK